MFEFLLLCVPVLLVVGLGFRAVPQAFTADAEVDAGETSDEEAAKEYAYGEAEDEAIEAKPPDESSGKEDDGESESESETPSEPKVSKVIFDDELIATAKTLGVPERLARSFDSVKALEQYLLGRSSGKPVEKKEEPKPKAEPFSLDAFDLKVDLDPEAYDEKVVEFVKQVSAMNEHYASQMKKVGERLEAMSGMEGSFTQWQKAMAVQAHVAAQAEFEARIAKLGKDYEELFGSGDADGLDRQGEEFAARSKLWDGIRRLRAGFQADGETPPSEDVLFRKALRSEFGDKVESVRRRDLDKKVSKRNGQTIAKPTAKRSTSGKGVEAAAARANQWYKEHGMGVDETDEDEF